MIWGSAGEHALTVEPRKLRTFCRDCPKRTRRETHVVLANGVALASGCEFHAHQHRKASAKCPETGRRT